MSRTNPVIGAYSVTHRQGRRNLDNTLTDRFTVSTSDFNNKLLSYEQQYGTYQDASNSGGNGFPAYWAKGIVSPGDAVSFSNTRREAGTGLYVGILTDGMSQPWPQPKERLENGTPVWRLWMNGGRGTAYGGNYISSVDMTKVPDVYSDPKHGYSVKWMMLYH